MSFRRYFTVGYAIGQLPDVHSERLSTSPELKPSIPSLVSNEIDCDLHQPGFDRRVCPEAMPAAVGAKEAVLCEILCSVFVPQRCEQKSKDRLPMELEYPFEVLDIHARLVHGGRNRFGCRARFHSSL